MQDIIQKNTICLTLILAHISNSIIEINKKGCFGLCVNNCEFKMPPGILGGINSVSSTLRAAKNSGTEYQTSFSDESKKSSKGMQSRFSP